ncbi:MAG: hypothetical protein R3F29_06160 [Planctomycetota bacterium]
MTIPRFPSFLRWLPLGVALAACASGPSRQHVNSYRQADFGQARVGFAADCSAAANRNLPQPQGSVAGDFLLNRMALAMACMADGCLPAATAAWDQAYALLRQQGINQNASVAAFFTTEAAAKTWKGDPFEQALAFVYTSINEAGQGRWDNARATAMNATFQLQALAGSSGDPLAVLTARGEDKDLGEVSREESMFALGYLVQAVANLQMWKKTGDSARRAEATEQLRLAEEAMPTLGDLCRTLRGGAYDALIVCDYGCGPRKVGEGPDNAVAVYRPRFAGSGIGYEARVAVGGRADEYAVACNVNSMAEDYRWNDLETMRLTKSRLGTALVKGGAVTTVVGIYNRNVITQAIGVAVSIFGIFAKATAGADTRHCECLPQLVYLLPVKLDGGGAPVEVSIGHDDLAKVVVPGLKPNRDGSLKVIYLRMTPVQDATGRAPGYLTYGKVVYANDSVVGGDVELPYVLGGTCVRRPSAEALAAYQRAGYLEGWSVSDLELVYQLEGIEVLGPDSSVIPGLHVLEGGRTLFTPAAGSMGFLRLFCQAWPAYTPRSQGVRQLVATGLKGRAPRPVPAPAQAR